jgi:hypothetical protein
VEVERFACGLPAQLRRISTLRRNLEGTFWPSTFPHRVICTFMPESILGLERPMHWHNIEEAYDLFGHQHDGVLKVAVTP